MQDQVKALKLLPEADKEALCGWLSVGLAHARQRLHELSVFRQGLDWQEFDQYRYTELTGIDIYYAGYYPKTNLAVFFDSDRKLIYSSRFYLSQLVWFVRHIDPCLFHLRNLDVSRAVELNGEVVSIEKWFVTYGHFKDEAYSVGDFFYRRNLDRSHRVLLDYPIDDYLDTDKFKFNLNYTKIDRFIFGDRSLNAYAFKATPLLMKGLVLVENGYESKAFHSFPMAIRDRIRRAVITQESPPAPERVLLTRSASYRDIGNKQEVEALFASAGFTIVNPEMISYEQLVELVRNAKVAAMYWGSALTNMVYFNSGTRIFILKSESYIKENIALWRKVIAGYALDVVEVPAVENVISLDELVRLGVSPA